MTTQVNILLTGNELMNGDVIDTNSVMFAQQLNDIGLTINKKVTIADELALLRAEIVQLSQTADVLLINGGLGPTIDDLTSQALAQACCVDLHLDPQAHLHLKKWAKRRNTQLNQPNLKQAYLPLGSEIVDNATGSAVGIRIQLGQCLIICTPGVPSELSHMLKDEIIPSLQQLFPITNKQNLIRLQTFGMGESTLQALVNDKLPDWPNEIAIGFRAAMPLLEVKLSVQCPKGKELLAQWQHKLSNLLGSHILTTGKSNHVTVADYLVPLLIKSQQKITLAESCTGGLIASQITAIAGASAVFEAGFVTYSNKMKSIMLDVPAATLVSQGAVSKATVLAMAKGALAKSNADYVIAVSGIAGPDGATEDKPVGSVWIAWGNKQALQAKYYCIPVARQHFQQVVAARSLDLIRRMLINSQDEPYYDRIS
ncbi:CinA family nicotinamide mononucleotide deamidase-related protein [Colwellia sp. MB3u-70]|uniref:CinA family nicotinamide mononucleotide deamidase-related protein n=1 Tax=unclassified Colwellia TaxID=196834 RepID=UPI0015F68848|nr:MULTISPECIES: CinA family nicotinamide mononucleotide deamidase-related protein [unclassified Colwellia]MBA6292179.1 CinA family nicotinamide mononucleotide deamidase-related protein [Colwellia sp. MB3u-8]MBA6305687.1 CinA family nicotinamide mononucleotide deamidase-related protein [Colwellia sp. MB3u-70]